MISELKAERQHLYRLGKLIQEFYSLNQQMQAKSNRLSEKIQRIRR